MSDIQDLLALGKEIQRLGEALKSKDKRLIEIQTAFWKYAKHSSHCLSDPDGACTCGLEKARVALFKGGRS